MRSNGRIGVTHVSVVPMDRETVLHDQTVVIADGRIETVAPAGQVNTDRMRLIDARGNWLMPGLSDMHVHIWDPGEARLFLANGVTHVRNMWGTPLHLAWRQKVASGEVAGPRLTTTSPIVDGGGPDGRTIWPGSVLLTAPEEAGPLVARLADRGYPQVKALSALQLEPLRALGSAAKGRGLLVTGHCPRVATYEEAIDAGMTCFEHLAAIENGHMMDDEGPMVTMNWIQSLRRWTRLDLEQIRVLAARMAREEIWNCPTLVVRHQVTQARADALATPHMEYVRPHTRESWDPKDDFRFRGVPWDELVAAGRAADEVARRIVGVLRDEGAPLLLGTDTPNPYVVPAFSIHLELAHLRASGLSPYEVFRTATADAARFLGEAEDWGTVAPGRRADLVLLSRDPLQDVDAVQHVEHVFVNGHDFDRKALDDLLAERLRDVTREADPVTVGVDDVKWAIRHSGRPLGRMATRKEGSGSDLTLEEEAATFQWGDTRRRAKAKVDPTGALRKLRMTTDTGFGRETLSIERTADGYRSRLTAVDGVESESHVQSEAVPLSPRVLVSSAASFGAIGASGALTFEDERLILASVSAVAASEQDRNAVNLKVSRPGEVLEFSLSFDDNGELARVTQQMPLGVREWAVEPPPRDDV
jgi:imidazolonepropionase-like amidohydrolase